MLIGCSDGKGLTAGLRFWNTRNNLDYTLDRSCILYPTRFPKWYSEVKARIYLQPKIWKLIATLDKCGKLRLAPCSLTACCSTTIYISTSQNWRVSQELSEKRPPEPQSEHVASVASSFLESPTNPPVKSAPAAFPPLIPLLSVTPHVVTRPFV